MPRRATTSLTSGFKDNSNIEFDKVPTFSQHRSNCEPRNYSGQPVQVPGHAKVVQPKKPARSCRTAAAINSKPLHLDINVWPSLPEDRGFQEPTAVQSALTVDATQRLNHETRATVRMLSRQDSMPFDDPTRVWVARLRDNYSRGTLWCTRHQVEEGSQVKAILRRGTESMDLNRNQ